MLRIGITGGIGSGKSIVSRLFHALGVPVYDADTRARWVMENDALLRAELTAAFGPDTYDAAGRLNRPVLAGTVFNNPVLLAQLNGLVHPHVGTDFERWASGAGSRPATPMCSRKPPCCLRRAPTSSSTALSPCLRRCRCARPACCGATRTARRPTCRPLWPSSSARKKKWQRADYVLTNDDVQPLLPQVLALHAAFRPQPANA